MSSYLFILGQEVLLKILEHEFSLKNINRVKACINERAITHIMYANDIVLFSKAARREASAIVERILTSIVGGLAKA